MCLRGTKHIDLFQPARQDRKHNIEEVMLNLAELVKMGKFDHIGLSEVCAETLRRAHAVSIGNVTLYQGCCQRTGSR